MNETTDLENLRVLLKNYKPEPGPLEECSPEMLEDLANPLGIKLILNVDTGEVRYEVR